VARGYTVVTSPSDDALQPTAGGVTCALVAAIFGPPTWPGREHYRFGWHV